MAKGNTYPEIVSQLPADGSEITFEAWKQAMANAGLSTYAQGWLAAKRAGVISSRNVREGNALVPMIRKVVS